MATKKSKFLKVYAVVCTDHDETGNTDEVVYIFATNKMAQKYADKMNEPEEDIDDYDFDPELEYWVKEYKIYTSLETVL